MSAAWKSCSAKGCQGGGGRRRSRTPSGPHGLHTVPDTTAGRALLGHACSPRRRLKPGQEKLFETRTTACALVRESLRGHGFA